MAAVTKVFWDETPKAKRQFVADPRRGSQHNRGCAVDLTLFDLETGQPVPMPSAYDEASARAAPSYRGGPPAARRARDLLRAAMAREGFKVNRLEWWHFDHRECPRYPLLDLSFAALAAKNAGP